MKKLILAVLALVVAAPALSQSWTSGSGVTPTWTNTNGYVWTPPIGTDSPHPADAFEPAAIGAGSNYTPSLWIDTPAATDVEDIGTAAEAKFRITVAPSFIATADPILFPGLKPAGHPHTFFGWMGTDGKGAGVENANYALLRNNPRSSSAGGPINATLYWTPSMFKEVNGLKLILVPEEVLFYYFLGPTSGQNATRLRRDLAFIGGADPSDFNDTARRAEYAAAGLEYPGGRVLDGNSNAAGFGGWQCLTSNGTVPITVAAGHGIVNRTTSTYNTVYARYLKGPNGEDPWAGQCLEGMTILGETGAPNCWDGTILRSPDGRDHFRYGTRAPDNDPVNICPANYVRVPHFVSKHSFKVGPGGFADYGTWYLASDRMNPPSTAADPSSHDACRRIGPYFCPGATLHFDWMNGWQDDILAEWQQNCVGMVVYGVDGTHADCDNSSIADTRRLRIGGAPPQANLSPSTVRGNPTERAGNSTEGQRYFPPEAGTTGDLVVHHNH
jgi:hypothetical protein